MCIRDRIKNPGGGLAPIGGYVAGRKDLIEQCAYRLTSPGLGKEVGASLGVMQSFYQGLFLAPTVVAGALKGAIFAANVYEKLGYAVVPDGKEERHDIIQAVTLGSAEGVIAFCQGIQDVYKRQQLHYVYCLYGRPVRTFGCGCYNWGISGNRTGFPDKTDG